MLPHDTIASAIIRIPLYNRRTGAIRAYALIDAVDADLTNGARWGLSEFGYAKRHIQLNGRWYRLFLHRAILGLPIESDGREGDHVNRNRLDNRRENLRIVTHDQNMQNRGSFLGGTSRFRGVYWEPERARWRAQVVMNGRRVYRKRFASEEEAGAAAHEARLRLMPYATD